MRWLSLGAALLLVPGSAGAEAPPSRGRLVANVESIQPGTPFYLGVIITLQEQWHTYWLNPGDAGMPPSFQWQLPEGFTAGPGLWPAPMRIGGAAEHDFGFLHELRLFWKIQPPADLAAGTESVFTVDAAWLVCKEICVPQTGRWQVTLPVRPGPPVAVAATQAMLLQAEAAAPAAAPEWTFRAVAEADSMTLYAIPPATVPPEVVIQSQFFPFEPNLVSNRPGAWTRHERECRLRLERVSGVKRLPERFRGVLVPPPGRQKEMRALEVDAGVTAATAKKG